MSLRLSTKMVKLMAEDHSLRDILAGGRWYGYSTNQPADADDEPTGVQAVIFTLEGNAFTPPVRSSARITAVGTGTLDTVTVGGKGESLISAPVTISGVAATDSAAIAAAINAKGNSEGIEAVDNGDGTVDLFLPYWLGAQGDGLTAAITQTSSTCTIDGTFSGGTDAVNGLDWDFPSADGVLAKPAGVNWRGDGLANVNIGWMRFVAGGSSVSGDGADNVRFDCSVATSGGDLTAGSLVVQLGVLQSVGNVTLTIPRTAS